MKKVLKDKENEISKSKKQLHWAREDAIKEYHDSDALLAELGGSFADGFDDCLHQVKASFLDLDLSHITINGEGQTPACYVESEGTDDVNPNPQGNEKAAQVDQEKSFKNDIRQLEVVQTIEEKKEEAPVIQQKFFGFSFYLCINIFWSLKRTIYVPSVTYYFWT